MTKKPETTPEPEEPRHPDPKRFKSASVWLGGDSAVTILSILSWIEIVAIALVIALFYPGFHAAAHTPVRDAVGWDILRIDANRAKQVVFFDHAGHQERLGKDREACKLCHHLSKPMDGPTRCCVCHRDMYRSMPIFDHESHRQVLGGNVSCLLCHVKSKAKEDATPCEECHSEFRDHAVGFVARSFESAMHSRCVGCHRAEDQKAHQQVLSKCNFCHPDMDDGG